MTNCKKLKLKIVKIVVLILNTQVYQNSESIKKQARNDKAQIYLSILSKTTTQT